ncbi:hypothetical protein ACIQPQ_05910 [Streptomyces sp. NPDC091281]|uniref:hypothetical protein n=1 Tax=Streptomyces sp. NPDC091281 TaxID=3365985 RepID=UPI00382618EE
MKRSSGARLCATAAVGALSLALITGCSSDSDKGSSDEKGAKGASDTKSSAPAAAAVGSAELEKLLLVDGDVKGFKVEKADDSLPADKSAVKVDKAECEPLAYALSALPPGDSDALARTTVAEDKAASMETASPEDLENVDMQDMLDMDVVLVGLSSYEGDGAQKAVKGVSDAVAACGGGLSMTSEGETQKLTKVTSAKGTPAGDESTAFSVLTEVEGSPLTVQVEVVRTGGTVATFYAVNLAAMSTGGKAEVPPAVIEAQAAKLK